MTEAGEWRDLTAEERAVVAAIVSKSNLPARQVLLDEVNNAAGSNSTPWILDIRSTAGRPGTDLPDGPLPVRAYVPSQAAYRGEIIVWIRGGRLDGLEYAWVADDPPTRWPRPDEIEIVPDS